MTDLVVPKHILPNREIFTQRIKNKVIFIKNLKGNEKYKSSP
jgi:hypothetical protein